MQEQNLRKTLGLKLSQLDDDLFAGKFHDKSDVTKTGLKMNKDKFFQRVAPLVYELTGTEEDCEEDPGLPGRTLSMAKDIMRKKFRHYNEKKKKEAKRRASEEAAGTKAGPAKSEPRKRPTKRKLEPEIKFSSCSANDVQEFFQSPDVAYKCLKCGKSLTHDQCWSHNESKQYYCKKCFDKGNELVDLVQEEIACDKDAHTTGKGAKGTKGAKGAKGTKGKGTKGTKRKDTKRKGFNLHDRVWCQYPGYGKKWFRAEIYGKYRGNYNVYFLDDGAVQKAVPFDKLKTPAEEEWAKKSRTDFLQKSFMSEEAGEGTWHAIELGKRKYVNHYICSRVDDKDGPTVKLHVYHVRALLENPLPDNWSVVN